MSTFTNFFSAFRYICFLLTYVFLLTSIVPGISYAENDDFAWVKSMGGTGTFENAGNTIRIDSDGSVYIAGYFEKTVDFDPGPGTFFLTSQASVDIFITKLDTYGDFVWAKSFDGTTGDYSNGANFVEMVVDMSGDIYISSYLWRSTGPWDVFINKLNSNGEVVWEKVMEAGGNHIAIDPNGNIYMTGGDSFVTKLNSNGDIVWARSKGGTELVSGKDIALDPNGNIYTTGRFIGTVDFDPGPEVFNLTSHSEAPDIFVSKFDSSGDFIWANATGGVTLMRAEESKWILMATFI